MHIFHLYATDDHYCLPLLYTDSSNTHIYLKYLKLSLQVITTIFITKLQILCRPEYFRTPFLSAQLCVYNPYVNIDPA